MIGQRIEDRRKALGLTQAHLARESGVPQQSLNSIIKNNPRSSRHLLPLARALRTTPAFLTGQSSDAEQAPGAVELTNSDHLFFDHFTQLGAREQSALRLLTGALASANSVASAARLPSEDELAVVFEALLDGIDASLPLVERARLLAQRLPIGLSQLKGVVREPTGLQEPPSPAGSPRALATPGRVRQR